MNTLTFHQDWAIFITNTERSCINSIDTVREGGGGVSCIYFLLYRVKKII
ncbi:MAG: hypothetical protein ACXWFC_02865 [Nitrososphaeraceae archaeon]